MTKVRDRRAHLAVPALDVQRTAITADSYDRAAEVYARHLYGELEGKPLDRLLLERFVELLDGEGPVCDLGCGPGQIAAYLAAQGARDVFGVDLSPGMVQEARRRSPDLRFEVGDMRSLDHPDGSWAGIAAFYSIVHFPPAELPAVFAEWSRVVRPGGLVLLSFHLGAETKHAEEMWGVETDLHFQFFDRKAVEWQLAGVGWKVIDSIERPPYGEDVEYPSRRAYVFARNG